MHSHLAGAVRYLTLRSLPRVLSLSSLSCSLRVSASAAYLRRLTSSPLLSSSLHAPNCPHSKLSPAAMAEAAAAHESLFQPVSTATGSAPAVNVHTLRPLRTSKVTIVGTGAVGMACAISMLNKSVIGELVLADIQRDRLAGEVLDLQHAGAFLSGLVVACDENYEKSANSDICIITAGVRQAEGETRLDLAARNVAVLKSIVPPLVRYSPDAIFLVVSNPADIMTYITWRLSGLPINRVIGSGTYLDSSRFRNELAHRLKLNARSVHGWIIGEHGDSSVAVWSGVNVAGVPLRDHIRDGHSSEDGSWEHIHKAVVQAAYDVIKLKGYTNWAIGAAVASLVECILKDEKRVVPVSTAVNGLHGVDNDVFLSVPCVLGRNGVDRLLKQELTTDEQQRFLRSAESLFKVQANLEI